MQEKVCAVGITNHRSLLVSEMQLQIFPNDLQLVFKT